MNYDTVYFWIGGTERGHWGSTMPEPDAIDAVVKDLQRQGYHAIKGSRAIGAPEGPPKGNEHA